MDAITAALFVAFVAGGAFTLISFVLGSLSGQGDGTSGHDGAHDVGHGGDHGAGFDHGDGANHGQALVTQDMGTLQHATPAPSLAMRLLGPLLSFNAMAVASCVGGGVGLLLRGMGLPGLLCLAGALPAGLVAGYLVGGFVGWLRGASRYERPFLVNGTVATVIAKLSESHVGEVMYLRDGKRCAVPARAAKAVTLDVGAEVIILEQVGGVARVALAAEVLEEHKE